MIYTFERANPITNDYILFVNRKLEIYFQFKTFPNRFWNRKRLWLKCIRFLKNLEFRTNLWINYGLEKKSINFEEELALIFCDFIGENSTQLKIDQCCCIKGPKSKPTLTLTLSNPNHLSSRKHLNTNLSGNSEYYKNYDKLSLKKWNNI